MAVGHELRFILRGDVAGEVPNRSDLLKTVEQSGGFVDAVVGPDHDIGEADGAVVGYPFQDVGALVAHRTNERDPLAGRLRGQRWGIVINDKWPSRLLAAAQGGAGLAKVVHQSAAEALHLPQIVS